jgi:hypothetical protein
LGFRGIGFSPIFSLLKPTFSLLLRPYPLPLILQPTTERSPTDIVVLYRTVSANYLVPYIFGAGLLDQ